ncbi:MAG: acyl-CoA desaturase [Bacteroidia bacterium]
MENIKGSIKFNSSDHRDFFKVLRKRVDQHFIDHQISKYANGKMIFKTIVILALYFIPYILLLTLSMHPGMMMLCWSLMGFGLAGIGMSIMHDANHGAYSANSYVNNLLGYSLNLIGGSVFNWKNQHNIMHHTYTNVVHYDEDIADKLILRMSPHTQVKKTHQFQYLYAFLLYGLITIYWALLKDFLQFRNHIVKGVNPQQAKSNRITLFRIIGAKIFYFSYMLVIPYFLSPSGFGWWIAGFFLMHLIAGFVLTVIFQLAHTVEGTQHPLASVEGNMENSWAVHQLCTTVDFARKNKLLSFYIGGLNYQVEHHLFPRICHIHYPKIAPIVEETAREFGIPYLYNDTFWQAFRSHVRTLQRFGWQEPEIA